MTSILVVDDELSIRKTLKSFLSREGYNVSVAADADEARELISRQSFDVVLSDIILPKTSRVELLAMLRDLCPDSLVIMMTGEPTVETAAESLRLGAFDYLIKPVTKTAVIRAVGNAVRTGVLNSEKSRLEDENLRYREQLEKLVIERTSQLDQSENLTRILLDAFPCVALLMHPGTREIVASNLAAVEVGAIPGKTCYETWANRDQPCPWCLAPELWDGKEEQQLFVEDGSIWWDARWIRVSDDLYMHYAFDITDARKAEIKLRESEEQLRAVFENATTGIVLADTRGNIREVNKTACKILGRKPDELSGLNFKEITYPDDLEPNLEEFRRLIAGEISSYQMEKRYILPDGSYVWCDLSVTALHNVERVIDTILAVLVDISERKVAKDDARQSYEALAESHQKLMRQQEQMIQAEKLASLGQIAAGVAHEINNPIAYISSNLELLKDICRASRKSHEKLEQLVSALKAGDQAAAEKAEQEFHKIESTSEAGLVGEVEEMISDSLKGAMRVRDIVNDLRNYAHPAESGTTPTDLNEVLDSCVRMVWNELKYKCKVIKNYATLEPVECNAENMSQVFLNLLVNAGHAIPEQGKIELTTSSNEDHIRVTITDTGTGIDPETVPRLFDPFYTTKPTGQGTGLGLAIAHSIVVKHGGRIDVWSSPGKGSAFTVVLPKHPPEQDSKRSTNDQH